MRYAVIPQKNKREIVLLRGRGCAYRGCTFCDYHLDSSPDDTANYALNLEALGQVTGRYGRLEVINSGSFAELDEQTMGAIRKVCVDKKINALHFESHWCYREKVLPLRAAFRRIGVTVKVKIGVETFDIPYREDVLRKGMGAVSPDEIAAYFDECCLLQGLAGQTEESMRRDIETALTHFERVCINIMEENTSPVKPDIRVVGIFRRKIYPLYAKDERVDILLSNSDFGVGVKPDAQ